jgi:HD-like signal output (HDOD) protein
MSDLIDHELSHEDLQKVMSTIDIPACPIVVTNAMQEAQKDEPDLGNLAKLIGNDAGLSAAALKLANSPLYGSSNRISGVRQAVDRLGTKNIVCVVVSVALRASMNGVPAAWLEKFWQRTTLLAIVASLIAKRQYGISPDAAYTYALFHDAAIPMMMRRFPNYAKSLRRLAGTARCWRLQKKSISLARTRLLDRYWFAIGDCRRFWVRRSAFTMSRMLTNCRTARYPAARWPLSP